MPLFFRNLVIVAWGVAGIIGLGVLINAYGPPVRQDFKHLRCPELSQATRVSQNTDTYNPGYYDVVPDNQEVSWDDADDNSRYDSHNGRPLRYR